MYPIVCVYWVLARVVSVSAWLTVSVYSYISLNRFEYVHDGRSLLACERSCMYMADSVDVWLDLCV